MDEIRSEHYDIMLTAEESRLLLNIADEMDLRTGEVVGIALRVLQKCREFIGE